MQLITPDDATGPCVQMIDPVKKDRTTYREVIEKWSVPPDRLGDVLALAGDTADNVPGMFDFVAFHCLTSVVFSIRTHFPTITLATVCDALID